MSEFIRSFKKITELKGEELFSKKLIKDIEKCKKDCVFPAIRKGEISFYYKGCGLFKYKSKFTIHHKYGIVPKDIKDYISQDDLVNVEVETSFVNGYEKIKERCDKYAGEEDRGVSNLYKYNVTNSSNVVLLDTEIRFDSEENSKRITNKIDLLLFNKSTQTLLFVEAKHFSNTELWASGNNKPEVIEQIKRYEDEIARRTISQGQGQGRAK